MNTKGPMMVAGLGNPGLRYAETRHNAGFQVVESLGEWGSISLDKKKFDAEFGRGRMGGCDVLLVRPQSYMNRSGIPVQKLCHFFDVAVSDLVVVYDDIDLPLGRIRIREKGGHGGHNGIRSLIEQLGTRDFSRVRIGVGRPEGEQDVADYVLSGFSRQEKEIWLRVVERAREAVSCILQEGLSAAMQKYQS
ncbi:PTH1 family peptidyl-tRNA hydrolase [Desulfobotulus alkaliphilus]|uniref:Peptidyl-tRNA hydrolase n=1 Tax=Desulfobotulus alkaliphilus TaxID=622671 RepID=A0A562RVW7_9BACT|nr:aminoacyl-tRNA hydrolase [Desulfobotulus alkaliphilus]TWI73259.1 PTH1 family peptidyl-tRNA hydrolase [Desulfobotulus alkaliphilus]